MDSQVDESQVSEAGAANVEAVIEVYGLHENAPPNDSRIGVCHVCPLSLSANELDRRQLEAARRRRPRFVPGACLDVALPAG